MPVDSITTIVTPQSCWSQSNSLYNSVVVVPNVRVSRRNSPSPTTRTDATTVFECTSNPAQRGFSSSILHLTDMHSAKGSLVLRDCQGRARHAANGDRHNAWYARGLRSTSVSGSRHHIICD